jgi:hypothetical protein
VQLCKISESRWSFLNGEKQKGTPFPRTFIIKRIIKNSSLLEELVDCVLTALRVGGVRKISKENCNVGVATQQGVHHILSFFTAVVVETAEQISFDDTRLRLLYIFLSEGLKTHINPSFNKEEIQLLTDWKLSACLVISQISRKTRFGGPFCKALCKGLAISLLESFNGDTDGFRQVIAQHILMTACILSQHNQLDISPKFLSAICQSKSGTTEGSSWVLNLLPLLGDCDISSLINALSWAALKTIIGEEKEHADIDSDLAPANLSTVLCQFVQRGLLKDEVVREILAKIFMTAEDVSSSSALHRFVKTVSQWLPRLFDEVVLDMSRCEKGSLMKYISSTTIDTDKILSESICGDSLFVALNSPQRLLRVHALELFCLRPLVIESPSSRQSQSIAQAAFQSLTDFDFAVAMAVWQKNSLAQIFQCIDTNTVLNEIKLALFYWFEKFLSQSTEGRQVLTAILHALSGVQFLSTIADSDFHVWLTGYLFSVCSVFQVDEPEVKKDCELDFAICSFLNIFSVSHPILCHAKIIGPKSSTMWFSAISETLSSDENSQRMLQRVVSCSVSSISTVVDLHIAESLSLLLFTSHQLRGKLKFSNLSNLLMQLIAQVANSPVYSPRSSIVLVKMFSNRWDSTNVFDYGFDLCDIHELKDNFNPDETNFRISVLKSLISSSNLEKLKLVDSCLESLFANQMLDVIAHFLWRETGIFVQIGVSMLSGILTCNPSNSMCILFSCIVAVWCCAHPLVEIRSLGVSLSVLLSELPTSMICRSHHPSVTVAGDEVVDFFSKFVVRRSAIVLHADASVLIIGEHFMTSMNSSLLSFFLKSIDSLAWNYPTIITVLIRSIQPLGLSRLWSNVRRLLLSCKSKSNCVGNVLDILGSLFQQSFPNSTPSIQREVISLFALILTDNGLSEVKTFVLSLLTTGLVESIDCEEIDKLYQVLMEYQLSRPGDSVILCALSSLNTKPNISLSMLCAEVDNLLANVVNRSFSGLSIPFQRLIALIETAAPTILKHKDVSISEVASLINCLFSVLHVSNQSETKHILSIEYYKAVILEGIYQSLSYLENSGVFEKISDKSLSLSSELTEKNVTNVMYCLGSVKTSQVQVPSMGILRALININPMLSLAVMKELGFLLSSTSTAVVASKDKLLSAILELVLETVERDSIRSTKLLNYPTFQQAIQCLCLHIPQMSMSHRSTLLRSAIKVVQKQPWASTVIIHLLFCHTLISYELEDAKMKVQQTNMDTLCFSKAAQRRAKRTFSAAGPEEFYLLATLLVLEMPVKDQLSIISNLLIIANQFAGYIKGEDSSAMVEMPEFNISSSISYVHEMISGEKNVDLKSISATLVLLHLEFVLEILDNKGFHRSLAILHQTFDQHYIQGAFLTIADGILRLVSTSDDNIQQNNLIVLRLENDLFPISLKALLEIMLRWSLDGLESLQRLLDGPSFVSILQELMNHDVLSVRQRAILVLKGRLQMMLVEKSDRESSLYLDLSSRMRESVRSFFNCYFLPDKIIADAHTWSRSSQSALAQSSIMCLDVLIQYLGQSDQWKDELTSILNELLGMVPVMYDTCSSALLISSTALETKKLLGSIILCCSTIFKVLQVAGLSIFPSMIKQLLSINDNEMGLWQFETSVLKNIPEVRLHILFLRSIVSSCNIMVAALPTFVHPHLSTILSVYLRCFAQVEKFNSSSEITGLSDDANNGLNIIATRIPPRLLLPVLQDSIVKCMGFGSTASTRMVHFMLQVSKATVRSTVMQQLSRWMSISMDMMDSSLGGNSIEGVICDCVVTICLKLTEGELKSFVLKLVEWRRVTEMSANSRRSRNFYLLVKSLVERLKFLFYPTMGLLWEDLIEDMKQCMSRIQTLTGKNQPSNSKKRKRDIKCFDMNMNSQDEIRDIWSMIRSVLTTVQSLCETTGSQQFISKVGIHALNCTSSCFILHYD